MACLAAVLHSATLRSCPDAGSHARRLISEETLGACGFDPVINASRLAIASWGLPEEVLCAIRADVSNVYMVQNDEDEVASRKVLLHMKHCELRDNHGPVLAPSVAHKASLQWFSKGQPPRRCLSGPAWKSSELTRYHWTLGVWFERLTRITQNRGTFLWKDGTNYLRNAKVCSRSTNLGPGAAVHLSSTAEPLALWLKKFSVLEFNFKNVLSRSLCEAGAEGTITPQLLASEMAAHFCTKGHDHNENLPIAWKQTLQDAVPWAIRAAPARFCFQAPDPNDQRNVLSFLARPGWVRNCTGSVLWG